MSEAIKQIAEHYGMKHQILKAMEELAELSAELSRLAVMNDVPLKMVSFKEYEDQLAKVEEEMADVEIMLEQIKYFFDSFKVVEEIKVQKLLRQLERMKGETK